MFTVQNDKNMLNSHSRQDYVVVIDHCRILHGESHYIQGYPMSSQRIWIKIKLQTMYYELDLCPQDNFGLQFHIDLRLSLRKKSL